MKLLNKHFGVAAEKLSAAAPSRPACAECALHEACDTPFIKPYIPEDWSGTFLFIVEVSKDGERGASRSGVPLGEREILALRDVCRLAGISRRDVALHPVLRCRPNLSGSKKPKITTIRACRPFLLRAIQELKPKFVLLFGDTAAKSYLNSGGIGAMAKLRGRELPMVMSIEGQAHLPIATAFVTSKVSSLLTDPHQSKRMAEDLRRLLQPVQCYPKVALPKGDCIGFDTEYSGDRVFTLAVADKHAAIASGVAESKRLLPVLKRSTLVGHNVWVDVEALLKTKLASGLRVAIEHWLQGRRLRDTSLEARLADENRGKHGYKLESLTTAFFNVKDWKAPTEALGPDSAKWPPHLRNERCRLDAWATLKVHERLEKECEGPVRLSHAIAASLRRMYWAGVYISKAQYKKFEMEVDKEYTKSLRALNRQAKRFGLKDFTPKDANLREYVYGERGLGLKVESYTKGGLPSVSVKHLKEFKDEPAIATLIQFSKYDKLKTTYCESLASKFVDLEDGTWMPVQINPLAAKTGRRSSNAPNFQNWPPRVRQIIVSRFKSGCIADNDYSKLEPIAGGWVTGEEKLTEYFVKYPNGYIQIGNDFFKKTCEKNTDEYKAVKSLVLAIIYNKKKWSLAEDLWVNHGVKLDSNYEKHEDKAGEILDEFLNRLFPGVKKYHALQEQKVLAEGVVYNALGQARRLPLPPEPPRSEKGVYRVWLRYKAHVINQAINYPIQSLASYITGCALIDMEREFLKHWKFSYYDFQRALMEKKWPHMPLICIEVHDDLVQDIPKGLEKKTKEITHAIMAKPPSLVEVLPEFFDSNVKLSVDTNVAAMWGMKS